VLDGGADAADASTADADDYGWQSKREEQQHSELESVVAVEIAVVAEDAVVGTVVAAVDAAWQFAAADYY